MLNKNGRVLDKLKYKSAQLSAGHHAWPRPSEANRIILVSVWRPADDLNGALYIYIHDSMHPVLSCAVIIFTAKTHLQQVQIGLIIFFL